MFEALEVEDDDEDEFCKFWDGKLNNGFAVPRTYIVSERTVEYRGNFMIQQRAESIADCQTTDFDL